MSTFHLIDTSAYFYRAFYALPPLSRPSDGFPVGAIHGFCGFLWRFCRDYSPTHRALVLDAPGRDNFRKEAYADYKANRTAGPDDLYRQMDHIQDCADAFGIKTAKVKGFEADDVIATLAADQTQRGGRTVIFSSDKDLMQLLDDESVAMFDPMKKVFIDADVVLKKFGVPPSGVIDAQALIGDATDNVPGVPKVGPKTAAQLLADFESLDGIYAAVERGDGRIAPGLRERLAKHREDAYVSRDLVRLRSDVDVNYVFDDYAVKRLDAEKVFDLLDRFELVSLKDEIKAHA
jgi:DNA polymerase-1